MEVSHVSLCHRLVEQAKTRAWCTDVGGRRQLLAKGRPNKRAAITKLKAILEEQQLLAEVNGAMSVARLCEEFLADANENLEPSTYESYQYGCQKFVNLFGPRLAHTIEPLDIERFSKALKTSLNDTSRGIVLRSVQRCFNWGVEMRLIPPHRLGKIRKPQSRERDRFLTDEEFRQLLRATNPENGSRSGAVFRRFLFAMEWTFCRPGELAAYVEAYSLGAECGPLAAPQDEAHGKAEDHPVNSSDETTTRMAPCTQCVRILFCKFEAGIVDSGRLKNEWKPCVTRRV